MNAETRLMDEDGGHARSRCMKGLTKECKDNAQANSHMKDKKGGDEVVCSNCMRGGVLLCCSGKGCQRRYHPSCVDPPLIYIPLGFWHCIWCTKKKMELGVHSVSGVKSILDSREVVSNNKRMQREYFVKYHGLAHAHNRWIPESKLLHETPKLLHKFKRKQQVTKWKKNWSIPHRLLLKREILLSKLNDQHFDGHGDNGSTCRYEWLVKWTGLGYDNATWELDDASFLTSLEGRKLIDDYESGHKKADRLSKNHFEANEERKASFAELSVLPSGDSPGFYKQHLTYENKLHMRWHNGQSAIIVDDQIEQERVKKVILFILSLNCNVKRPFLIISTSTTLSVWEAEFLRLAPSANLVIYKGNRDVRSSIRALEFFNEDGGILFQILLSCSHIIVKDLYELRCIIWEAIIIHECQRSRILGHLDNIKSLKAEMRLLLVSGQIKEDPADYSKLLSFLKSGQHGSSIAQIETYDSASISSLNSQLEKYVVFKCKSGSTRFVEYWVPACLSNLQLEQYCSMLLSNLMLLCSGQKSESVDALHDLIISIRKCCDHPYLLNLELQSFVIKDLPVEEHLNFGIQASGKLQLLEKILSEARNRGLRVLIIFQSASGSGSIGDILDDALCQRFGKDCYVRYDRGHPFTNETTGKFATNMQFSEKKDLLDIPNGTKFLPKPDISGLCDILHFSKNAKAVAVRILEHILEHYNVDFQEVSTIQAFEISVCWLAASLLKHEIDRKDSLALAKLYLNFDCNEEERTDVYSELWKHVKDFSNYVQNGVCVEKCNKNGASDSNMPELNGLSEEEKQKDFLGTCASKVLKSVTNELDPQMKSPRTVVSQDQTCPRAICLSPNTPGSFPVEADAISMESGSEDDRMNATTLITTEESSFEHWSNDVNPVAGSLERQSPIRSTFITQSDDKFFEDPQILVNEVVAVDNAMNISTPSAQLGVEADAGTSACTAVPEVRQWYSVMSPECDESAALEFPEITLPYMQPWDSNLWALPQMAMSAIPSFPENSASTVMPLDDIFCHSGEDNCYFNETEVILEAPNDLSSSFVFTSVPMNESTTHVPDNITIPGFMNSASFQVHSVASEMSHLAYPDALLGEMAIIENMNEEASKDPLRIEMEIIEKEKEAAFKIHEQKLLQLKSDYEKEFEKLRVKYRMFLQHVDTEVAVKRMELEAQCNLVLRNKVLAQVWSHSLGSCERVVVQCTEQEAMASSHMI